MSAPEPQVLKSIVNEKLHPETIHAEAAVIRFPNGTVSGNWRNKAGDNTAEYRRADLCDPTQDERVRVLDAENARLKKDLQEMELHMAAQMGALTPNELEAALRALEQGSP